MVWARLSKRPSTSESVFWFIRDFALVSGARHEPTEGGILVFESPGQAEEESPAAIEPVPAEPPVAAADATSGDVS